MSEFPSETFKSELILDSGLHYMNIGTSGPLPRESLEAQCGYMRWASERGPGSYEVMTRYMKVEAELRKALSRFFGGEPGQYALTQNTSEGINLVLNGLPWQPGDELLTTDLEHGGLAVPAYHLAKGKGLRLIILRLLDGADPLEALKAALTPNTRLLALSHVAYCDGRILPMEAMIHAAHDAGVPALVDAAQSAGQFPLNLAELGADFVSLPGQKWLLGPEGTGALYLHGDWSERLRPDRAGWASAPRFDRKGQYELHPDAARFEVGTRDPAASLALKTSLEFLEGCGMPAISERARALSDAARDGLKAIPEIEFVGPQDAAQRSGLIAFRLGAIPPPKVVRHLSETANVVARWIPEPHPPAVRISLHAYNTEADLTALFNGLKSAIKALG